MLVQVFIVCSMAHIQVILTQELVIMIAIYPIGINSNSLFLISRNKTNSIKITSLTHSTGMNHHHQRHSLKLYSICQQQVLAVVDCHLSPWWNRLAVVAFAILGSSLGSWSI